MRVKIVRPWRALLWQQVTNKFVWLKGVSRAVCVGVALKFEDMALKAWRFYGLMTIAIGIPLSLIYGLRLDMMPWVTSVLIGYLALELLSLSLLLLSVGTSRYRHPAVSHNPPPQPDHHSKDQPTVAVIIAAYNEEAMLPETVDGVLAQSVQPDRILVVDDGSSDGSLEVLAERYGVVYRDGIGRSPNYPSLQVLAKHHSGKAESLNAGVRLLQDDVVVTVDADTQMKAGSIAAVKTYFANDPELKVIGPLMEPVCEPGPLAKAMQTLQRYEYLRSFTTQAAWSRIDGTLTVSGACAAYRRDILMAVGAFDPTSWVEDYEVMVRIYRYCRAKHLRPKVLISPYLTATTDAPNSVRSFIHQRRRWIGGFLQTLLRYRHIVGNPKEGVIGTAYLVLGVIDACSPVYAIASITLILCMVFGMLRLPSIILVLLGARWTLDFLFAWVNITRHQQWQRRQWQVANEGQTHWFNRRGALIETVLRPFVLLPLYQASYWVGWLANFRGRLSW